MINGKTYVGSSINLSKTFLKYFNENALTKNHMLINLSILKDKLENFTLDILEYCLAKDVTKRKHYYLYEIKPAYNIIKVAGCSQEYIQTNEKSKC